MAEVTLAFLHLRILIMESVCSSDSDPDDDEDDSENESRIFIDDVNGKISISHAPLVFILISDRVASKSIFYIWHCVYMSLMTPIVSRCLHCVCGGATTA